MSLSIRQPAVAGRWYPDDPGRLTAFLSEHLVPEAAPVARPRALIVPHAGYVYSGATAAKAFQCLAGHAYKRVFVLGPTHHVAFRGWSAAPYDAFRTPLGDLPLDRELCREVGSGDHRFCQRPDVHEPEWSLEAELPFLQFMADEIPTVPLVCGQMTVDDIRDAAAKLLPHWDEETLVVVSTDFTHYGWHFDYFPFDVSDAEQRLPKLDGGAIDEIRRSDLEGFLGYVEKTGATICGRFPVAVLLAMLEERPAASVELLEYTNSGALTGDYSSSVSYAGLAVA